MLTWLTVLAVLGILGVTSYYKGAVRALVSLVGLILALFLTLPLSPLLRPLVPKVGLTNLLWGWFLPPVVVFALFVLIFTGIGFFVHHKVLMHFKYHAEDYVRIRWERLNRRLGLCVGLVAGVIYCGVLGVLVYMFGYGLVQATGDESPAALRLVAKARTELRENGLDRSLSSLDLLPESYYLATDVLGLIYNNQNLRERLSNYPPFLSMGERPEFQEMGGDADFQNMLQTKASVLDLINHSRIQTILGNSEIMAELQQVDLKDLYQYLKTGKSNKYDEERILGRWKLDPSATLTMVKKKNPEMQAKDMARVKLILMVFLPHLKLMATPDNKLIFQNEQSEQAKQMIQAAQAAARAAADAAAAQQEGGQPMTMDPRMAARYGLRGARGGGDGAGQAAAQAQPRPAAALPGIPEVRAPTQGTWERDGSKYKMKFQDDKGKDYNAEAAISEEELTITFAGQSLVMVR